MIAILGTLLLPFLKWIIGAVAIAGAGLGLYFKGRAEGKKVVQAEVVKENLNVLKRMNEAAVNSPRDRDSVIDRMNKGTF